MPFYQNNRKFNQNALILGYDPFAETWGFGYGFQKLLYKKVTMLPKPDNEKRVMNYGVKFIHLNRALKLDKAFNVITRLNFDYGKRYGSIYFFCGLSFNYFLYEPQDADVYNIRSIKLPGGRVKHLNSDYWPGYNVGVQLL